MKKIVAIILVLVLVFSAQRAVTAGEFPLADIPQQEAPPADIPLEAEEQEPPLVEAEAVESAEAIEEAAEAQSGEETALAAGEIGHERTFKIAGSIFATEETAVLAAKSEKALVYVVKSDKLSTYKYFYPDGTNENARASEVAQKFEEMYRLVSTPGAAGYFARPYDINGDGRIIILLCDIASDGKESGGTVGGYVSGFFNTADFTSYNNAAMIYADIAPNQGYSKLNGDPDGFYQTIMHEYAHLLSFSCVHANRQAGKNPALKHVFAEEAFAELAGYLYKNKFGSGRLSAFFTGQFKPGNGYLSWQYGVDVYANASFGAAALAGLAYYNNGGSINGFLTDARGGGTDTFIAMGDHFAGGAPSANLDNFNAFFNTFALDTFVSDPSKAGPHIKNVSFDSWNMIDLYGQPVLKPEESFAFSAYRAPYMPQYFVIPRMGTRLSADENVIKVTLTDADAKSRFYVVYPSQPFSGLRRAPARKYAELTPGGEVTIPVGQGNDFAVVAVNFTYSGTDAAIKYTAALDRRYPYEELRVPEAQNLKAEHGKNNVDIYWEAPAQMPEALTLKGYELYRDGVLLSTINTSSATAQSRSDRYTDMEVGKSYNYMVKVLAAVAGDTTPLKSAGSSKTFKLLPITVAPPQAFSAAFSQDGSSIELRWNKAEEAFGELRQHEPSYYEIYRDGTLLYAANSYATAYTDRNISQNGSYTYKLRSRYSSGETAVYSDYTQEIRVANTALNPPQRLKAAQRAKTVALTWEKPPAGVSPTGYAVYRNGVRIATVKSAAYSDAAAKPGAQSYHVTSLSGETESAASGTVSITVLRVNAAKPKIVAQPKSKTVRSGASYTLSVKASAAALQGGSSKLTYQWYKSSSSKNTGGAKIAGATRSSYSVPTGKKGTVYYYCTVINRDSAANGTTASKTTTKAVKVIVK